MKFAVFEQIKKSLESVKRYALGEIGNVANATVEAVEEIVGELDNKANNSHVHNANDVISGTIPITRGGTDATTASTALSNLGGFSNKGGIINGDVNIYGSVEEGNSTTASGWCSHTEGINTIASGNYAHSEGCQTGASGMYAHSEGQFCLAEGIAAHANGKGAVALDYQTAVGWYNKKSFSLADVFIVGNGSNDTKRANCFRVNGIDGVFSIAAYHSSGADYAEYFQWKDDNTNNEDRVGLFVTLDGEKISIAKPNDDILGIVSACPSVCGDAQEDQWKDMYQTDVYGRTILEEVAIPDEFIMLPDPQNPENTIKELIREAHTEMRQKLNENYDNTQQYIPRSKRPEWSAVGLLGKLVVIDDGSCIINGYCKVGEGGIAVISEQKTRFRVMARLDDNHIKILML